MLVGGSIMPKSERLKKVKYKLQDRMLVGSLYDNIMLRVKYNSSKLAFLYNVMIGQKHRMLHYKRLKKMFYKECTKNPYWEEREKVPNKNIVWFCWIQGIEHAPDLVKRCLESLKKNLGNKTIVIIDQDNMFDYIQLPEFIVEKWRKGTLGAAHFSDLIRLQLLIRYGGYWIDATVYCTDAKLLNNIDELPLFMYSFYYFGFNPEIMEANTWFLYATSNQNILCLTREFLFHYWKSFDRPVNYFFFQLFLTMALEYYEEEHKKIPIVSQANAHILATYINDRFDANKYELLKLQTGFHKLSTRFDLTGLEQEDTFYDRIIRKGDV